jgi:hypothetical protein
MKPIHFPRFPAFTLVELLTSVSLLSLLMLMFAQIADSGLRVWRDGVARADSYQTGRSALELLSRELAPAIVDTRMQFVIAPSDTLRPAWRTGAAPQSPVLLWMAPLGESGRLRCMGYYLYRDEAKRSYRLKRIAIDPPEDQQAPSFFPRFANLQNPRDATLRTSPVDASWFSRNWSAVAFNDADPANDQAVVATVADGVIGFWVQAYDLLGRPVPFVSASKTHPASRLYFNSAAYFQAATSEPFEDGASFQYLAQTPQSMKANRVPAAVELTIVTANAALLARRAAGLPLQPNIEPNGSLDLDESLSAFRLALQKAGVIATRTFTTRVSLTNGK